MDVAIVIVNHITAMPTQLDEVKSRFSRMPVEDGDGAPALCGVKEVGGITIAQKSNIAFSTTCRRVPSPAAVSTSSCFQKI